MDLQKEREVFEAWLFKEYPNAKDFMIVYRPDENIYEHRPTQVRWEAWQAAKAQAVPEWISVEDRLPELKEHTWRTALPVNVMIDGYGQYLCYPCQYGNGVFYWADATYYGNDKGEHPIKCDRDTEVLNVTHWMPLPDAPQEPVND